MWRKIIIFASILWLHINHQRRIYTKTPLKPLFQEMGKKSVESEQAIFELVKKPTERLKMYELLLKVGMVVSWCDLDE